MGEGRKVGEWIKYHPDGETPKIRGNYTSTFPYTYRIDYDSTGAFVNKTLFYHDSTLTRQHHWFDNTSFLRTVRGQSVTDSFIYYSSIDFYDSLIIVHFDSRVLETYYFQKHNKWHSSLKREVVSIQLGAQPLRQNETMIDQLITYETGPINQTIDGKHEGYWITLGKDKPEYGYPENGKVQHGGYVNGRKEGTWVKYHTDGITPKLIGHYQNNRPNGHYWKITPEGTIMEKGKFFHGKYKDTLYRYYPDGKLKYLGILDSLGQSLVNSFYFYNGECRDSVMVNKYNQSAQKRWVVLYSKKQCNVVDTVLDRNTSRHHNEWHYRVPKKREKKRKGWREKETVNFQVKPINPLKPENQFPRLTYSLDSTSTPDNVVLIRKSTWENDSTELNTEKVELRYGTFDPNGSMKLYGENGEIFVEGKFNNYEFREGKVYLFDEDVILLKVKLYRNGEYYADGQL